MARQQRYRRTGERGTVTAKPWTRHGDDRRVRRLTEEFYIGPVHDYCRREWHAHGWLDGRDGRELVCPGFWILTGRGHRQAVPAVHFRTLYEPVK